MRSRRTAWLAATLSLALAGGLLAQQRFRIGVDVLHIQVSVADADGAFVPGLEAGDFVLRVNGEEREIVTAWTIDSDAPHESWLGETFDATTEGAPTVAGVSDVETLPAAARRRFVVFIDLVRASRQGIRNVRRALGFFLDEHVKPADLLAVVTYTQRAGLEYVVPFTTRHDVVAEAVGAMGIARASEAVAEPAEGIPLGEIAAFYANAGDDSLVTDFIQEIEVTRMESISESILDGLRELSDSLLSTEGRKHVLMFSHGLPDSVLLNRGITGALDEFAAAARRADVVFHTFEPSNVGGGADIHDVSEMGSSWAPGSARGDWDAPSTFQMRDRSVLHFVARETGGKASFWRWAVKNGLEDVERVTNDYYLLAFPLRAADGETLEIEVSTRRQDVEVTWAPVELAVGAGAEVPTEFQRHFEVADALELGASRDDLGTILRAWVLPDGDAERSRVAVAAQIEGSTLETLRETNAHGRAEFELLGLAMGEDRNVRDYFRGRARADFAAAPVDRPLQPFRFASWLEVPVGHHYLKILVRESLSGRMFSHSLSVFVPEEPQPGLRLDPPLLVLPSEQAPMLRGLPLSTVEDRAASTEPSTGFADPFSVNGLPVTLDLSGTIAAGEPVTLLLTLNGVVPHEVDGQPRIGLSARFESRDGSWLPPADLEVMRSEWRSEESALLVMVRASLPPAAAAGTSYRLRVTASDAVGGTDASSELELLVLDR